MNSKLDHYRRKGHKKVTGWIYPLSIKCICDLSDVQKAHGIKGNVCEIGIHHGRFFILLHLLTEPGEYSIACDLFEDRQKENIGYSGDGNKEKFLENFKRCGGDLERTRIITRNSLNISEGELLENGGIRLFSVDGGHDADTAYSDIRLAGETIVDGGLIIVDDFLSEGSFEVTEAVHRYLSESGKELWPVALLETKLILTNSKDMADKYVDMIFENFSVTCDIRLSKMARKRLLLITKSTPRKHLKKYLQSSGFWKQLQKNKAIDEFGKLLNKYF